MTLHLGYITAGTTLYIPFHTFDSNGASITLTGLAVTDIEIYKNGSTTQRSSDAGYTLLDTDGIDFDGLTGIHGFSIDLADNTDAGFYAAGSFYWVVVSAVTVDTRTVSFVAATFFIGPVAANVTQLLGTAWLTPGTAGTPDVNAKLAGGTAWGSGAITAGAIAADAITAAKIADGAIDAATFAAGAINAAAIAADAIGASELAADAVTEIQSGLATAANLATVAGYIDTEITDIQTRLPAALVSGRIDASVGAMAANTLTASALASDAVTEIQSGLSTVTAAQVNAEVVDALTVDLVADSVATDGTRPTITQAIYEMLQFLTEKAVSGTTVTVKKVDGSTSLFTLTLDSSTDPTSITRAT